MCWLSMWRMTAETVTMAVENKADIYKSHGCFYTRTTGIWQSVWLEFVPEAYISGLKIETDAFQKRYLLRWSLWMERAQNSKCQIFDGER